MTAQVSAEKLDSILRKIQALLNQADHPNTGDVEAATFRGKAESMMMEYRIAEDDLVQSGAVPVLTPGLRAWDAYPNGNPFASQYRILLSYITHHAGVRWVIVPERQNDGSYMMMAQAVGFDSDLRYAEVLYQAVRLAFSARMEPTKDDRLSDEDNVFAMRNAGIERRRIALLMGWSEKSGCAKATRLYIRACEARGITPDLTGRSTPMKLYREEYARQFVVTINERLRRMRDAADSVRGALVLASRKEDVDEEFYTRFPNLRPSTVPATASHKSRKMSQREINAYYKRVAREETKRETPAALAGRAAGHRAASEADLGPGAAPSCRLQA